MSTNDFKAVAIGGTPNVATQAEFLASAYLGPGFQSGVAPSKGFNKVWRQSSMVAHVLAQLISDTLGEDVLDDGNATTLQDQLARCIKALAVADIRFAADSFTWGAGPFTLAHTPNTIMTPVGVLDGVEQPQDGSVFTISGTTVTVVASNPPFGSVFKVRYAYTP